MRKRVLLWLFLFIAGFLLGFVPQYQKARSLRSEVSMSTQELTSVRLQLQVCKLQDWLAMTYLEASRKNYASAAEYSSRFFSETQHFVSQPVQTDLKAMLEGVLSARDTITARLAKGDPAVLNELEGLLTTMHAAAER